MIGNCINTSHNAISVNELNYNQLMGDRKVLVNVENVGVK
jgi:hypothetical protein